MKEVYIDSDGYIFISGQKITDINLGHKLLTHFYLDDSGVAYTKHPSSKEKILITYFNQTLVVQDINFSSKKISCLYNYSTPFDVFSIKIDPWHRCHGVTDNHRPFVLSHKAQSRLLQSVKKNSEEYKTLQKAKPYYEENTEINHVHKWSEAYQKKEDKWSLKTTSPALKSIFPQLEKEIFKKTICSSGREKAALVLGAGLSHDAAFLADNQFNTTAVDISPEAIEQAQQLFKNQKNLNFLVQDFFHLKAKPQYQHQYDLIFEQTCFCAVTPKRRAELVKLWKSLLKKNGLLIGVFFIMQKIQGPPFGISQWELENLLKKEGFKIHLWTRDFLSHPKRQYRELFICAEAL